MTGTAPALSIIRPLSTRPERGPRASADEIKCGVEPAPEARALTVADATRAYIEARERRNLITGRDARYRLTLHVVQNDYLAAMPLAMLTANDLARWRKGLPKELRPATVNRLLNDLRAALRASLEQHWRDLPQTLPKEIEIGLRSVPSAEVARHALLSDDHIRRVIEAANAVDVDLGALVLVLAATGRGFRRSLGSPSRTFRATLCGSWSRQAQREGARKRGRASPCQLGSTSSSASAH